TVSLGSLWGTGYGAALAYLADVEDDGLLWAAMIGGDAALVATAIGQRRWQLSESRARLISIAGLAGGLAGVGIDLLARVGDAKVAVLLPTLGATAGVLFGAIATRSDTQLVPGGDSGPGPDAPRDGALLHLRDGSLDVGAPALTPR